MSLTSRSRAARILIAVPLLLLALVVLPSVARTSGPTPTDLDRACDAGEPYLAATSFRGLARESSNRAYDTNAPAVVAFSDTPANRPQYRLATYEQVGAVWGLAYRMSDRSVYAAAYHKVQLPFGPGGPGAVYRIDLDTGDVAKLLTVPNAGEDLHQLEADADAAAEVGTSRTSLGDIDLSEDESELFVTNLSDRRIYRFQLPSGQLLGSFAHGAAQEPWSDTARPFGLAVKDGQVYQGVVRSAEDTHRRNDLAAYVYQSAPDGTAMTQVLAFALDFRRGRVDPTRFGALTILPVNPDSDWSLDWQPWRDGYRLRGETYQALSPYPMPLLTDLAFDDAGNLILGFRDRRSDSMPHYRSEFGRANAVNLTVGAGIGDVLRSERIGNEWSQDVMPEFFKDRVTPFGDEVALGGVAVSPDGGRTVTGAYVVERSTAAEGAYWFENEAGALVQHEQVADPVRIEPLRAFSLRVDPVLADNEYGNWVARGPGTVGDVEVLCGPVIMPSATPTRTPVLAQTATSTPKPTLTASPTKSVPTSTPTVTPSATATPQPAPAYLPLILRERCNPEYERSDIALVIDTSSSMTGQKIEDARAAALSFVGMIDLAPGRSQVAVVRYDREAEVVRELTRAPAP